MGREGDREVQLAGELTKMTQTEHHINRPELSPGRNLREKVLWTIARSDGQPPTEAHQAIYRGAQPASIGEGITLGQWPLLKGGLAQNVFHSEAEARRRLRAQGSWVLDSGRRVQYDDWLLDWFERTPATSTAEKLYLFSRQFRSGRWLQPQTTLFGRDAINVYPISDAEVTAVTDAIPLEHRIDESAYFRAMNMIWPESVQLPLGGSKWRFESDGPDPNLSGMYYEARASDFVPSQHDHLVLNRDSRAQISEYQVDTLVSVCKELAASPRKDALFRLVSRELRDVVEEGAKGSLVEAEKRNMKQTAVGVWRLYCADAWYSGDWLTLESPRV